MKRPSQPLRLLVEGLLGAVLATLVVAAARLLLLPGLAAPWSTLLDGILLVALAGPLIAWRWRVAFADDADDATRMQTTGRSPALLILAVLAMGTAITVAATLAAGRLLERESRQRFDRLGERVRNEILHRFSMCQFGLSSLRGVYAASQEVLRSEFRAYAEARDLPGEFPGVRGFGLIRHVPRAGFDAFLAAERADGAPDFAVHPLPGAETRDLYVITTIEPLEPNRPAWGYDVGSDRVRREAVERAIDSGEAALTRPITLVQDRDRGPGYLLLLALYRNGSHPTDPAARRAALVGLVYAPIRIGELVAGVVDAGDRQVEFALFDGEQRARTLVHATAGEPPDQRLVSTMPLLIGGRTLELRIHAAGAFTAASTAGRGELLIGLSGALLTILSAVVAWQLARGRARALALAGVMTADLATAKTRAEAALRESQALFHAIGQHALVSVADRRGIITEVNEEFCRLAGRSRAELVGHGYAAMASGEHPPEFWNAVWRTITAGRPWRGEICNLARDGRRFWIDAIIAPLSGDGKDAERFLSIATDITYRKEAEAELQALNLDLARQTAAAESAAKAKGDFLATMSHEIRTPLNGVIGMASLLVKSRLDPQQREYAETIRTSGESLLGLINDILDFSRIESGKLELEAAPFPIHQVADEVIALYLGEAERNGVELVLRVGPGLPPRVIGDPLRVRQILLNLVSNAIKFTPRGRIAIDLDFGPGITPPGPLLLSVSDTGIGMPPEHVARIGQEFTQADASTTRRFGGSGLGLSICTRLIGLMGGTLAVDSRPGAGSEFRVALPLAPGGEGASSARYRSIQTRRVALVVADADERQRLAGHCTAWGMACTALADATALDRLLAGGEPPDVIVIDQDCPPASGQPGAGQPGAGQTGGGLALAEQLHGDPRLAGVVLVLLSPDRANDMARLRRAGVAAVVDKPVRPGFLLDALSRPFRGGEQVGGDDAMLAGLRLDRVLVAEDNLVNQRVALLLLKEHARTVDLAATGAAAVELFQHGRYDVVLMDCQMPEMDGYAATRRIRAIETAGGLPRTPIIALTANAMAGEREACLAAGMDEFLTKPLRADDLHAVLRRTLRPAAGATAGDPLRTMREHFAGSVDPQVMGELVALALDTIPAALHESRKLLDAGDQEEFAHSVHRLKGTALALGLAPLAQSCIALEELVRGAGLAAAGERFASHAAITAETLDELRVVLAGLAVD